MFAAAEVKWRCICQPEGAVTLHLTSSGHKLWPLDLSLVILHSTHQLQTHTQTHATMPEPTSSWIIAWFFHCLVGCTLDMLMCYFADVLMRWVQFLFSQLLDKVSADWCISGVKFKHHKSRTLMFVVMGCVSQTTLKATIWCQWRGFSQTRSQDTHTFILLYILSKQMNVHNRTDWTLKMCLPLTA